MFQPPTRRLIVLFAACALAPGCGQPLSDLAAGDWATLLGPAAASAPLQIDSEPVFSPGFVFDELPGKAGCHAPTLTALPDGELLAAWYAYDGPHELDGSAIYVARRSPGADAWQLPQVHIDRPEGDGNPVLYSEGDAVWLFQAVVPFGWSTAHIEVQRSFDRGQSWCDPELISDPLGANVRYPPVRTAAGTLLLPAYDDLLQRSLFFASTDGDRWTLRSTIETDWTSRNIQPSVTALGDQRLLAVMRNVGGDWLWATVSDDNGTHWAPPIDSGFPNPGSPTALLRLASGNLVLVFNDSRSERHPLSIAISGDGAHSWPHRRVLVDGAGSYSYPAAVQTPDGLIHVVYSHRRETIGHIVVNEAWIVNADEAD